MRACNALRARARTPGTPPNVTPVRFDPGPPRAYRQAAETAVDQRYVEFYQLRKVYPSPAGPLTVVDGFDMLMRKGEFVSLIGHSGCGKSTVLSMVAGLNDISSGGIVLDNKEVTTAGPDRAVVFQSSVPAAMALRAQNVALGVDRVYPHANASERPRSSAITWNGSASATPWTSSHPSCPTA